MEDLGFSLALVRLHLIGADVGYVLAGLGLVWVLGGWLCNWRVGFSTWVVLMDMIWEGGSQETFG